MSSPRNPRNPYGGAPLERPVPVTRGGLYVATYSVTVYEETSAFDAADVESAEALAGEADIAPGTQEYGDNWDLVEIRDAETGELVWSH